MKARGGGSEIWGFVALLVPLTACAQGASPGVAAGPRAAYQAPSASSPAPSDHKASASAASLSVDERAAIIDEYKTACNQTVTLDQLVRTISGFNTSDYHNWQRNEGDLPGLLSAVLREYRGSQVVDKNGAPLLVNGKTVRIPLTATVRVSSAWRNPKRNVKVGSVVGCTSKHLLGRALDVVPDAVSGEVEGGSSTTLSMRDHLFPTLWSAAKRAGFAIAEVGSVPVPCGTIEDHVHVHRN